MVIAHSDREALADVVREVVRAELAGIAAEVTSIRLRMEGKTYRDSLLRELAGALGLGGATWASTNAIALILAGVRQPPAHAAATAAALAGTKLSARQILRILQAGEAARAADRSRALCQWWPPCDDGGTSNDKDIEHGR